MSTERSEKIIVQCELAWPHKKGDCIEFVSEVLRNFFTAPDFDGSVFSDDVIDRLHKSALWTKTREIKVAIAKAKSGDLVFAGLNSKDLGAKNGHLAIVAGLPGQQSGTVIVPVGYAGSIGGAAIRRERLSATFKASLVRSESIDYFCRTPDKEPAASAMGMLFAHEVEFLTYDTHTKVVEPKIAFGKKVSSAFKTKVISIAAELGVAVDYLMAAMAFETGEEFKSSTRNKVSGATGLIQFMPKTAISLGTTTEKLAAMSEVDQLDYVKRYLNPWRNKLVELSDVYMAILLPRAVGKPEDFPLFARDSDKLIEQKRYDQNKGLDANKDGIVSKHEAAMKVFAKLDKGRKPGYLG